MSLGNCELLPALAGWFGPLIGNGPFNKKAIETSQADALKIISIMEKHLHVSTYLVGERITLADYYVAGIASRGFQHVSFITSS